MDSISKERRSWNMSRIRSADTKPELLVRSALHRAGFRFRLYGEVSKKICAKGILPGKPDIVLAKYRLVIFIHGCFWHCHEGCKRSNIPKTNSEYWKDKLSGNKVRDLKNISKLEEMGWRPIIIWECELKSDFNIENLEKKYMRQLTVGSMFSGIGGIDLGFEEAGFKVIWANEFNEKSCETFKNYERFKHVTMYNQDVHTLDTDDLEKVDIIASGFPCQAFSIAGYQQGFNDSKGRGNLFFETARFIDKLRPKAFLLENVRNLQSHDNGNTLIVIKNTLVKDLGYSFIPFVLNSKEYGNIPQTRERIYIVGFKNEAGIENIVDKSNKQKYSSKTERFNIPDPIKLTKTIHDCIFKKKQDDIFYYKENHIYYPTLIEEMVNRDTVYQWRRVYVRENKSNLCPTLTANMGAGGHNVPLIIDDYGIRKLTPKECLNFQGYPEDFNFPENMARSHCYMQAGNSVVVPVIKRIAEEIRKVLEE